MRENSGSGRIVSKRLCGNRLNMGNFNWTCPHCERDVTIDTESRLSTREHTLWIKNSDGRFTLVSNFFVCPNNQCRKFTLSVSLHHSSATASGPEKIGEARNSWNLIPPSRAKTFPDYIPKPIRDDYWEACVIQELSPKAAATLARRCLQGILRDFWGVNPGTLFNEIKQIEDKLDADSWNAIDAVRKIGNIGAHMESDINVIIDVDPGEAELLIQLVETLLREWYIAREERQKRMAAIVSVIRTKTAKPNGT